MGFHKDQDEANMHEPKHVQSATGGAADAKKAIFTVGDGTSELRRPSLGDLDTSVNDYALIIDTTQTSGSKTAITGGVDHTVTVNKDTIVAPSLGTEQDLWDGVKFLPEDSGFAYILSLRFKADTATANDFFDIKFRDTVTLEVFQAETKAFVKGAGTPVSFVFNIQVFGGSPFDVDGGEWVISAPNNINIWDLSILIQQTRVGV